MKKLIALISVHDKTREQACKEILDAMNEFMEARQKEKLQNEALLKKTSNDIDNKL